MRRKCRAYFLEIFYWLLVFAMLGFAFWETGRMIWEWVEWISEP